MRVIDGATKAEQAQQVARDLTAPEASATRVIVTAEGKSIAGEWLDVPGMLAELRRVASEVNGGDLSHPEAMLMNQAQWLQALSTRLIERGWSQEGLPQFEAFMRLGLRAQAQSRQSIEGIALLKQGPAIFARQANVAASGGAVQVNNNAAPALPARGADSDFLQSELSSAHALHAHASPSQRTSATDSPMAPVGKIDRS
ncbi:MAG: hypothetical protein ABL864_00945 [Terricaulis sp.]